MTPAIELARAPDGPVEIRLQGFVTAQERRVRRLRLALELVVVGVFVVIIVIFVGMLMRWDYARTLQLGQLEQEAILLQAERDCWRAAALRLPRPLDAEAQVRACVAGQLRARLEERS